MLKLTSMIFTMLGTTLAGTAVLVVLVAGLPDQTRAIPLAALAGAIAGLPLSYFVARRIMAMQKTTAA